MYHKHALGQAGEDLSANFLAGKGFAILARNWRFGHLELDLVCEKDGCIIFVEVKTRCGQSHGGPQGAINSRKMRNLGIAAQAWLKENDKWDWPCRFDVICLVGNGEDFSLEHYADAFNPCQTLDYCDSSWQS